MDQSGCYISDGKSSDQGMPLEAKIYVKVKIRESPCKHAFMTKISTFTGILFIFLSPTRSSSPTTLQNSESLDTSSSMPEYQC